MKKLIKRLISLIIVLALCILGYYASLGYVVYNNATREKSIDERITEIKNRENYTALAEIPKIYKDAVIAVEDSRFYEHSGVDFVSLVRALVVNVKNSDLVQGGSTITQQFAKNLLFSHEQNLSRKAAEFFATYYIEKHYEKDEILELYLNAIYYGDGYYSIYDASMGYFNVAPIDMSDYQATLLAGVPNAPSVYAPSKNLELAQKRQDKVIERMVEAKLLTNEEKNLILKER